MNTRSMVDDLLKHIYSGTDLNYISDLHCANCCGTIRTAVLGIQADKFDSGAWQAAASYILGSPQPLFGSSAQARKHLAQALESAFRQNGAE